MHVSTAKIFQFIIIFQSLFVISDILQETALTVAQNCHAGTLIVFCVQGFIKA